MKISREFLGKLNRLTKEKIDETLKCSDHVLACIPYMKQSNVYRSFLTGKNEFKKILMIASVKDCGFRESLTGVNDASSCYVVAVPSGFEFVELMPENGGDLCSSSVMDISKDPIYELTPEIIYAMMKGVETIMIDGDENAYCEVGEYNDVNVLVGERIVHKGKSKRKEIEVNGVFYEKSDAEKMGEMLKSYGSLNGIEYIGYDIKNFIVL